MTNKQLSEVAMASNRYPNIDVTFEVEDEDEVASGDSVTVIVQLQREGEEEARVPKVRGQQREER